MPLPILSFHWSNSTYDHVYHRPLPVLLFHWSNSAHDLKNKTKERLVKVESLL